MGILQSLMRSSDIETDDEEENVISSQNRYDLNFDEKSEHTRRENFLASLHQWQNGNRQTPSHQSKYLTISVPDLKGSSSLAYTSVNDKVKKSAAFVEENGPPNVGSTSSLAYTSVNDKVKKSAAFVKENGLPNVGSTSSLADTSVNDKIMKSAAFVKENGPPNVVSTSSLAYTSVNDKIKKSAAFVKENGPPNVVSTSSLAYTSVNDKIKKSAAFVKENGPPNVVSTSSLAYTSVNDKTKKSAASIKENGPPYVGSTSSLADTSVNDKVKKSAASVKENGPPNVGSKRRWRRKKVPVDDEEEKVISSQNQYDLNFPEKSEYARWGSFLASPHQWQKGNRPTHSHQSTHVTISVPELRGSSSLAYTSVNDKVKTSAASVKENGPPNVGSKGRRLRKKVQVMVKCMAAAAEDDRWIKHCSSCHRILLVGEGAADCRSPCCMDERTSGVNSREEEREREEDVKVQVKNINVGVDEKERRIKHYRSSHKILLVGEGDFSFSACLALAFGSAPNIIATSLNSKAFLKKNYGNAMSNIAELRSRGSKVMHGIDATEIANHEFLLQVKFDRIIFNFPYAGLFPKLSTQDKLRNHRRLVSLFLKNAKEMISENGEIHISHKTNSFHADFNLENIASSHGLRLIHAVKFKLSDYPGYDTKSGFGGDRNFNCYPSKTFKFGLKSTYGTTVVK